MIRPAFVALALASAAPLSALPARAAPDGVIDCQKAETPDEKAICSETVLIQDDAHMATLFKVATSFVGMGVRGDMQDAQVRWLETRHACKGDKACLEAAYAARIAKLQSVIDAIAAKGPF